MQVVASIHWVGVPVYVDTPRWVEMSWQSWQNGDWGLSNNGLAKGEKCYNYRPDRKSNNKSIKILLDFSIIALHKVCVITSDMVIIKQKEG